MTPNTSLSNGLGVTCEGSIVGQGVGRVVASVNVVLGKNDTLVASVNDSSGGGSGNWGGGGADWGYDNWSSGGSWLWSNNDNWCLGVSWLGRSDRLDRSGWLLGRAVSSKDSSGRLGGDRNSLSLNGISVDGVHDNNGGSWWSWSRGLDRRSCGDGDVDSLDFNLDIGNIILLCVLAHVLEWLGYGESSAEAGDDDG